MIYDYPRYKLHNDPLSAVLCQIRFSRVRKMAEYIPAIQDRLRRSGYPEDASGVVQQISVVADPSHAMQPQVFTQKRDEFRSVDNTWSITIGEDMIALVTTAYDRFAGFLERLRAIISVVDEIAEIHHGRIHRIGLRYVDLIDPPEGQSYMQFLQESLHGPKSTVLTGQQQAMNLESIGTTKVGRFILRITQNDQGILVPPDLIFKPMHHKQTPAPGKLITLVDSDHFVENPEGWPFDLDSLLKTADVLHAGINKAWFTDFITEHALKHWEAERVSD